MPSGWKTERYLIVLDLEYEIGHRPSEEKVAAALSHSTAPEALAEALDANVSMWVPTPEEVAGMAGAAISEEGGDA